jgi:ABC-type bacteriocin/lantibiotic exporter with double-glycine peptidase domain
VLNIFSKILFLLSPKERNQAYFILFITSVMALIDILGVVSIMPFMAVLANPNLIETNFYLQKIFDFSSLFSVKSDQEFLFFLGILVFLILIFSLIFKAITTYIQIKFIQMRHYSIGKRLMKVYLSQPYSWYLNRHSADFGKTILSEVNQIIGGALTPVMELISKSILAIALIILIIFIDFEVAFLVGSFFVFLYLLIFKLTNNFLLKIGKERLDANKKRFIAVNDVFSSIKAIKITNKENYYINNFSVATKKFSNTLASLNILSQIPRFALEGLTFGGMLMLTLFLMSKKGSLGNSLPLITLYAFAAYRLLPAIQQIYSAFNQLKFIGPAVDSVYQDIKNLTSNEIILDDKDNNLNFKNEIVLRNIFYSYPNSKKKALSNISIKFPFKSTVGIVGKTGSGKTTLVDIILGLLEAEDGSFEVDGQKISQNNIKNWQKLIGYVPQDIFLSDCSIKENIALGINTKDINLQQIENVSKTAKLHDFVINNLPDKYETIIGERGVRLSGGQRQRIGIARALYNNPKILILDEATSSLDNNTEKKVMDAIYKITDDITVIIIAHRLNTIKNCDKIFKLEDGKFIREIKYKDII